MKDRIKTFTTEHSLESVMGYFIKGFKLEPNQEVFETVWFIDQVKNKVFIKRTIATNQQSEPKKEG